jgi:hypothetical protein
MVSVNATLIFYSSLILNHHIMKLNRIIGRAAAIGAMSLLFAGLNSNLAKAQETQPANMAKTQAVINKDSWETWKQDMKTKFQQVREQADKIKSDALANLHWATRL